MALVETLDPYGATSITRGCRRGLWAALTSALLVDAGGPSRRSAAETVHRNGAHRDNSAHRDDVTRAGGGAWYGSCLPVAETDEDGSVGCVGESQRAMLERLATFVVTAPAGHPRRRIDDGSDGRRPDGRSDDSLAEVVSLSERRASRKSLH
ncbi:MAG: hypothetical protein KatS3mg008_0874 [Acidimicrobiales bacterium]|nr:MAG: hypothetical protein KatS3mg008_0874 [Acidimicrobiales bacterium]